MIRSRYAIIVLTVLACTAPAHAGGPPEPDRVSQVTTGISADVLRDLPTSESIFSILETVEPSLVSDRMSGSGAYTGQAARISGFFSSWSQTLYRVGEVSLSDPTGSGAPLLLPDPEFWGDLQITTGMMPASINAEGVAISLEPHAPAARWTTTLGAAAGFPAKSSGDCGGSPGASSACATPLIRTDGWDRAVATASGPILTGAHGETRLAGFFGGSWTRGEAIYRADTSSVASTAGSGFAHLVFMPGENDVVHTIGWVQKTTVPFDQRVPFAALGATTDVNAGHLQTSWEHGIAGGLRINLIGAFTERSRVLPPVAGGAVFERLTDGPVSQVAYDAPDRVRQWTAGVHIPAVSSGSQAIEAGLDITGARDRSTPSLIGPVGELVDGTPARVWAFNAPAASQSNRHDVAVNAYAADTLSLAPNLTLRAGLRFDRVSGSADGAASGVTWQSWLPRAAIEWTPFDFWKPTVFAGIARSAYRLPLDLLAIGDPGAPTASVYQWTPAAAAPLSLKSTGALIARVGPGSGGSAGFAQISPDLERPTTDELTIGIETHPSDSFTLGLRGFLRRERHLLSLVDTGAPISAYSGTTVFDLGNQLENPADDQQLPIYNRLASSFGQDTYVLTNSGGDDATSKSIEITGRLNSPHVILFGGLSANMSETNAATVGYGPLENDPDLIGNAFVDPNAATYQRGRPFSDRAYTIKIATILRLPAGIHAGFVARYQDGQPFARVVIATALNQGAEAVRAFPDGGSRFTFTETLDARLQKTFPLGSDAFDVVVDVFNLLNTKNEVEERTVTGAAYRSVTAIQQPRAVHAGFRVTF